MIKTIENWESKGFRIAIYPKQFKNNWIWTAGVYIGENPRAEWVDTKNNLPLACYNTYHEAFNAVTDFIFNYKPKKLKR